MKRKPILSLTRPQLSKLQNCYLNANDSFISRIASWTPAFTNLAFRPMKPGCDLCACVMLFLQVSLLVV